MKANSDPILASEAFSLQSASAQKNFPAWSWFAIAVAIAASLLAAMLTTVAAGSPGPKTLVALAGGAGLAILYAGCCLQGVLSRTLTVLGALGVVGSFALTGHTTDSSVSPLLRLLLALHVAIVGYWLGSTVALVRLTRVSTTQSLYKASTAFSASAVWLVPAILPIGVGMAIGLLPNLAALRTVYGALLLSKVTGFAVLLALAAFNRWRVVPALEHEPLGSTRRFRQMLQAEYLLIVAVLSVTAVMTSLYSWH